MDRSEEIITVNGEEHSHTSTTDRGLIYGHGLFETMLYSDCGLPLFERHIQRLKLGCKALSIEIEEGAVIRCVRDFLTLLKSKSKESGVVKVIVTAGEGGRGYQLPGQQKPNVICQYFPPIDSTTHRSEGVQLWTCNYRLPSNPYLAGHKHLNRLDQVIARAEWTDERFSDGILMDQNDLVIETTTSNIFLFLESRWVTPKLDQSGVAGVMRSLLIEEILPALDAEISVEDIPLPLLTESKEVFVCNSVKGVMPVTMVKEIAEWPIGEMTEMVQSALTEKYCCFS